MDQGHVRAARTSRRWGLLHPAHPKSLGARAGPRAPAERVRAVGVSCNSVGSGGGGVWGEEVWQGLAGGLPLEKEEDAFWTNFHPGAGGGGALPKIIPPGAPSLVRPRPPGFVP